MKLAYLWTSKRDVNEFRFFPGFIHRMVTPTTGSPCHTIVCTISSYLCSSWEHVPVCDGYLLKPTSHTRVPAVTLIISFRLENRRDASWVQLEASPRK